MVHRAPGCTAGLRGRVIIRPARQLFNGGRGARMRPDHILMYTDDAEHVWRLAVTTDDRSDDEQLALLRLARQLEWADPHHAGLVGEAEKTRK
jgi:hypothetical protein